MFGLDGPGTQRHLGAASVGALGMLTPVDSGRQLAIKKRYSFRNEKRRSSWKGKKAACLAGMKPVHPSQKLHQVSEGVLQSKTRYSG